LKSSNNLALRPKKSPPPTNHGTHVAGIIGANKKTALESAGLKDDDNSAEIESAGLADGMCPDSN
jgi:hypothetical protein